MSCNDATQFWNERYAKEEFIFGKAPNEYLVEQASQYLQPESKVLCIADGEGRNGVWLARQGMRVTSFDVSDIAISKAKQLAQENQVTIECVLSDVDSFAWPENTYDAIIAIFIQFADPAMRGRIFQSIERALKPGGWLILQGYTPKQLEYKTGGPADIAHLYTENAMQAAFQNFNILDLCSYEKELSEGSRHSGMSALLGLVARKV
ncbi:Methyltransferase domain-containing protein [Polynucleobacter meluiroseus]|uniref:Methyltransferase domain-containing protein n=1 Tax=Polynucleobacter meluiroseus TaxID=1938814 RepID=A0A240DZZ6_9BURK|nr:class I SAM-dependent methyltransferase [Polynucleobacter meluiroseus]SNX28537.1 Methyltransferase domain-containing protein [Polynucleobacter meluiroseus]